MLGLKIALDIATTMLLFVLVTPITILVTIYVLKMEFGAVDARAVLFADHGPWNISGSYPYFVLGTVDATQPFEAYWQVTKIMFSEIVTHIRDRFDFYHILNVFPVVHLPGTSDILKARRRDPSQFSVATGFMLPMTTMLATAFATTMWVAATAMILIVSKVLCHTFAVAERTFRYLHRHPHIIFWAGIFPSIVVFFLGGVVRLLLD
jgi:hypothetical protein